MIPLDKQKEIESQNHAAFSHWLNAVGPYLNYDDPENFQDAPSHDIEKIFANFESLEFSDFKDIYKRSKLTALLNDSIWENTLKFIIDENFCERIIEEIRKNITENSNEEHDSRLD